MDPVQKRLLKELRDAQRNPNEQIEELRPVDDDDLFKWIAVIRGQDDSPYAGVHQLEIAGIPNDGPEHGSLKPLSSFPGGRFVISIDVPAQYPTQPPVMKFTTKVCHPNVHWKVRWN